jgi:phenylacetate-CoA ligase
VTVVTNLCSEASPQLRFLVGDYTQLTTGPCACGRTGPRAIGGFAGRADDMLKIRGVSLFPSTIEDAVRQFDDLGDEFEIVVTKQRELDRLLVRVETRGAMVGDRLSAMAHELEAALSARCLIRAEIELVAPGTLPRTEFKARRVKDLR